jgi:pyocin large subunit-like protein
MTRRQRSTTQRMLGRVIAAALIAVGAAAWQWVRGAASGRAEERAPTTTSVPAATRSQPGTQAEPSATPRTSREGPTTGASRGPGFKSRQRLVEHFEKHGAEFPGFTQAQYLAAAQALRDRAAGGDVLEFTRADGVITRFDRASGAFLAVERSGHIRTYFRPNDGESYFRRQQRRRPDADR